VNIHQLAPDEPLSPELVLVFSPELRAQALASLPPPVWLTPPRPAAEQPPIPVVEKSLVPSPVWLTPPRPAVEQPPIPVVERSLVPSFGVMLVSRVMQLAAIFLVVTIVILAMSLVANAMR